MPKHVLGIDLGTTFSSVSVITSDSPELVPDTMNKRDIPSLVSFQKKNGKFSILVGNFAKKNQSRSPKMTVYDSKRMLGRRFDDKQIQRLINKWPFNIEQNESGGISIVLNGIDKKYQPYEISGEILKFLAQLGNSRFPAEEHTKDVVITIPANFGEEQRTETVKAAEYAGLNVLQLINEPTAAGLAFGLQNQNTKSRYVFVFDFGGGTLDVSLLHQNGKDIEVIATDGDMFLGGRDFDENTINFIINELGLDEDFLKSAKKMNHLRNEVIGAKIQLSVTDNATIVISENDDDSDDDDDTNEYDISLKKFEQINQNLIDQILKPVERLLDSKEIKKNQIDSIILVGGSSNMQFVKRKLKEFFGKDPYNGVNPEEAVAIGAGIVASKYIERINPKSTMKTLQVHDICPISIGTSDLDGTMTVLIQKGSKIPITKTERFHTVLYRQDTFPVDIYEGENKFVKDNFHLSDFSVYNLPPSEDEIEFDVTFSLDQNNILSASAKLVNGSLSATTSIEIKRTKPSSISKNQNQENGKYHPNIREIKLLYQNIQRFINFNMQSLLKTYSKKELLNILNDAKFNEENIDSIELPSLNDLMNTFTNLKLKKYFINHSIPKFLTSI